MKRIATLSFLLSIMIFCSSAFLQTKQKIFLQIVDPAGQNIRGTSVERFYERQIIATNFSGFSTGNAQVKFTMPSGAASATLANLQGGKQKLPSAVFSVTEPGEAKLNIVSTVRLEEVVVISVSDANGSTEVTLQAARIGATYFGNDRKTGLRTVSGKTGYDFANKQSWTSF